MRRRALLPLLAAPPTGALLSACGLGNAPRRDFFVLRDPGTGPTMPGPRIDKVLLVSAMALPGLYDGDRMIFSADGRSRSPFQFGYWSERPAQSLQTLALARMAQAGRFRDVVSSTSGVRGELLLSLRLDELYLDTSHEPDRVSLTVVAELIDWRERRLIGRQAFQQSQAVQHDGAAGLADAASEAMGRLLGELVDWAVARSLAAIG
jgi:cholesterol transport system auxiliary component